MSRRLAFELACSNTPSRVAGAVAFGRMLAYAALRLPTTSTGTYGTGVHVLEHPIETGSTYCLLVQGPYRTKVGRSLGNRLVSEAG